MSSIFQLSENANPFTYEVIDTDGVVQKIACFTYQCEPNGMVSFLSLFDEFETSPNGEKQFVRNVSLKTRALSNLISMHLLMQEVDNVIEQSHSSFAVPVIKQETVNPQNHVPNTLHDVEHKELPEGVIDFDESYIPDTPDGNLIEEYFDSPAESQDVETWINISNGNDDYKKNKEHFREAAKTYAQQLAKKGDSLFELNNFLFEIKKQGYKEHGDENEMLSELCQMIKAGLVPTEAFITQSNYEHFRDYEPQLSRIYDNTNGNLLEIQSFILKEEGFFSFYCDVIRISAYLKQKMK